MKKYIVEFIGTFFLVLTIVITVNGADENNFIAPLIIGSILMVMVYAGMHISGAHYNPAVTIAVLMRGKIEKSKVFPYIIVQIAGAVLAAVIGASLLAKGSIMSETELPSNITAGFVAEFLGTFALVWVILQVATTKRTEGNSYYGLAIGFTVFAMAFALGGFETGACFNPAVAIGGAVNGLISWATVGIVIIANIVAAILATFVFKYVDSAD